MVSRAGVIFERTECGVLSRRIPSGQQEHIAGFHTKEEAMEWRVSRGCGAWRKTRG